MFYMMTQKVVLDKNFLPKILIGIPVQVIVGPKSAANNKAEIKIRSTDEQHEIDIKQIQGFLKQYYSK